QRGRLGAEKLGLAPHLPPKTQLAQGREGQGITAEHKLRGRGGFLPLPNFPEGVPRVLLAILSAQKGKSDNQRQAKGPTDRVASPHATISPPADRGPGPQMRCFGNRPAYRRHRSASGTGA